MVRVQYRPFLSQIINNEWAGQLVTVVTLEFLPVETNSINKFLAKNFLSWQSYAVENRQ